MASVTQLVPTLTGGVSQQPDELKVPGQVNVANNVLPDVTHGLLKRPGGKLVTSLSDGTNNSVVLFIDPSGLSPTMTGSFTPTFPPLFNLLIFFKMDSLKPVRSICLGILVPKGS